jgi:internalin A
LTERRNQITSIPESFGQLSNLTRLDLDNNEITSIPESLGQLSNLTVLYLNNNEITSIPESLGQLSNLTWLDRAWQSDYLHPKGDRAAVQSDMA